MTTKKPKLTIKSIEDKDRCTPKEPAHKVISETTSLSVLDKELSSIVSKPIDKEEFTKYLGISMDRYDVEMDKETAAKYKRHIMSLRHGMHAVVPLNCYGGERCPFGSKCPLTKKDVNGIPDYEASIYPLFQSCPIEQDILKIHMLDLVDEYHIQPEDYTDLAIVSKLATLDVLEARCNMLLATDSQGVIIEEVGSVNPKNGKEFLNRRIHPAFEMIEKIHRMKQDLIKSMVGTRREKYKKDAATGNKRDQADLTKSIQDLLSAIEEAKEEEQDIIDAEYAILDDSETT